MSDPDALLAWLRTGPARTTADVAAWLDVPMRDADRALWNLQRRGVVRRSTVALTGGRRMCLWMAMGGDAR